MFSRSMTFANHGVTRPPGRWRLARAVLSLSAAVAMVLQPAMAPFVSADPASPLAVTVVGSPSPVASGAQLTYTISMKNTGGASVSSVVMTDLVNGVGTIQQPPGLPQLTITSTQGSCSQGGQSGTTVTCQIGTIPGGGSVTVTIRGQVTAPNGTTLNDTASVTGTKSAQNFTTNASTSVLVQGGTGGGSLPDLTLNKTGPTSVTVGTNMTYTLTVNNVGTVNTSNVRVVDTLPAGVTLQTTTPFSTTSLFVCVSNSPTPPNPITVTCDGGTVNAGANATIKINAVSPSTAGTITNTAVVDPNNAIAESNELNNSSAAVNTSVTALPPPTPLLTITKTDNNPDVYAWSTGAGPDPVNPGQQLVYKIQVKNNATTRADDVVMTDGTQGLDAASITASQVIVNGTLGVTGGCVVAAPQVTCSVRSLNPGGTITYTLTGTVLTSAGTTILNTATVTGNIKNTGVSASDNESTTVRPAVDLTITKAGSPNPVCARSWPQTTPTNQHLSNPPDGMTAAAGSTPNLLAPAVCEGGLQYDFVVGNSGNQGATNVMVRDPLPAGTIFDSYSTDGGFACSVTAGVVTCAGGSIPAASIRHISFVLVAPPSVGTISNTVTVDPNNAIFESDETNNTATATTDVSTGVDLVVWKSDSKNAKSPGDAEPVLTPGTSTNLGDGYDPVATRGTETYTIYVDNVGTQDTAGIKLVDTLPADTVFLSVVADAAHGFTCSSDGAALGGNVTCVGGFLKGTEAEFYDPAGPNPPPPGDDYATIKIRVFARSTVGTMHNVVRVDPDNTIAEANELNNTATDDTTVTVGNADKGAYNQLSIVKTNDDPASGVVATNGWLTYRIHVSNLGTDPVSNVVVTDTLPSGSRFISAADSASDVYAFHCSHDGSATGGVITCSGGAFDGSINVAGVGTTTRDILVKVFAPGTPQTAVNLAKVDPNSVIAEGNEFDNSSQATTTVKPCTDLTSCKATNAVYELTIVKDGNRPTIARNGLETYTLTVSNLGTDPISGITVKDFLPAGARFLDAKDTGSPTDPSNFSCGFSGDTTGGTVTCVGGVLNGTNPAVALAGVSTTRVIQVRAFMPDTPGTYTNRSLVDPANVIPEGNEFNNESDIDTTVVNGGPHPYVDLSITKSQVAPGDCSASYGTPPAAGPSGGCYQPGQVYIYTVTVTNGGEADAFNVSVRDVLPPQVGFVSALDSAPGTGQFTCTFTAPNIDCTGATIPAGGSRDITIRARAPFNLGQLVAPGNPLTNIYLGYTNQAFVDPFNAIAEGDESNNSASVDTYVRPKNDLTIKKSGPTSASQNETAEYDITVTNNGVWGDPTKGSTVTGVKVVDPLPVGLIPIGSVEAGGDFVCQVEENPVNKVTCIGDLAAGDSVDIKIHVFVTADGGTLDNEACVDPDHVIDETNETNNCSTAFTDINPAATPADLAINKTADKGTVTTGDTLTYTVAVINQGGTDATGQIEVIDPLPSQVTFVNTNADAGWTCTGTTTVDCKRNGLSKGSTTNIKIVTTVNSGVTASFTNEATLTGNSQTKKGSVTTSVGGSPIDLVLTGLSDNPDPANVGQNITYTFAVANGGSTASGAFDIVSKMDAGALNGLSFVGAAASQGFICGAIVTDTVTCTGSLPAGQSTNVKIVFQVLASTPTLHTLDVKVDPSNAITEVTKANNNATETTTVSSSLCTSCIDLVAGGILVTPDPVAPGGSLTRIATMSNAGDQPTNSFGATNQAELWVYFDGNYETLGSYSATAGFTCTADTTTFAPIVVIDCIGDLGPGQGVAVTVNSTLTGAATAGTTLDAYLYADPNFLLSDGTPPDEFTTANNFAAVATSVVGP